MMVAYDILNLEKKTMASKREKIKLKSSESYHCYFTHKNKTSTPDRIELTKYDPTPSVRKHVKYKETK